MAAAATSVIVLDRTNNTTCTINLHGNYRLAIVIKSWIDEKLFLPRPRHKPTVERREVANIERLCSLFHQSLNNIEISNIRMYVIPTQIQFISNPKTRESLL